MTKGMESPSPRRMDYNKKALKGPDGISRCTYVKEGTKERCKNLLGLYPKYCWVHSNKMENLLIRKSGIENGGNGLFAGEKGFKKGDIIGQYGTKKNQVSQGYMERRCKGKGDKCWEYVFCEDPNSTKPRSTKCWDSLDIRSTITRYSNSAWHSKFRNNAYFDIINGFPHIIASRNIAPYKEIFTDYGPYYF